MNKSNNYRPLFNVKTHFVCKRLCVFAGVALILRYSERVFCWLSSNEVRLQASRENHHVPLLHCRELEVSGPLMRLTEFLSHTDTQSPSGQMFFFLVKSGS